MAVYDRVVRVLGLVLVAACGRISFDAAADARGGDGSRDGAGDVATDGPSRFGTFAGMGGGMALAVSGAENDLVVGGWLTSPTDLGGGTLPYVAGFDLFVAQYSEAGELRWARALGSTGDDYVNDVATDANGNVYIVGGMGGPIDFGGGMVSPSGDTDAYIASYTSTGTFRWAQRIGTATVGALDSGHSVAVGPTEVVVTGLTQNVADAGGPSFDCTGAAQTMFIAAFSPTGTHLWSTCYGTASYNSARGVAADPTGNIYITGYYGTAITFGASVMLPSPSGLDVFVASFASSGTPRWAHAFGGTSDDWGNKLAVDAAGNVTATGLFTGTANPGGGAIIASGGNDAYFVSYSSGGVYRWQRRFGGSGCDQGRHVTVDAAGDVYVAGVMSGTDTLGGTALTAVGPQDGFIGHLASDGTHKASFTVGGSQNDWVQEVVAVPTGLIATGRVDSSTSACTNQSESTAGSAFLDRF